VETDRFVGKPTIGFVLRQGKARQGKARQGKARQGKFICIAQYNNKVIQSALQRH